MIIVQIEGGLVTGVSTDDYMIYGRQVLIVDYDIESSDPDTDDKIKEVKQLDGSTQQAAITATTIGQAPMDLNQFK